MIASRWQEIKERGKERKGREPEVESKRKKKIRLIFLTDKEADSEYDSQRNSRKYEQCNTA